MSSLVFFGSAPPTTMSFDRSGSGEEGKLPPLPDPGQSQRPEGTWTRLGKAIGAAMAEDAVVSQSY